MDANAIAALFGLVVCLGYGGFVLWEIVSGQRSGEYPTHLTGSVTRKAAPGRFAAMTTSKRLIVAACGALAIYAVGRLAGWWGAL